MRSRGPRAASCDVQAHETRYTRSGDLNIAYQVVGDGPLDLVYVPGWISNVELNWDEPSHAHVLERLARFSRPILFDKRGTGLSDPVPLDRLPPLEERMDDVRAVLDAVGSWQTAVFGFSEGGLMSVLFAATYPERVTALARSSSSSGTGRHGWTSTSSRRARTTRSSNASRRTSAAARAPAPPSR
jgi:pimeloyl-ACP methyl ester carboxylesterase